MKKFVLSGILSTIITFLMLVGLPHKSEASSPGKRIVKKQQSSLVFSHLNKRGYAKNELGVLKPVNPGFDKHETSSQLAGIAKPGSHDDQEGESQFEENNQEHNDVIINFFRKIANYFSY